MTKSTAGNEESKGVFDFQICIIKIVLLCMSKRYLLSSRLGVFFLPFFHCSHKFDKDGLSVLHLVNVLKPLVSSMLHSKFTKCGSKSKREEKKSS